MCTFGQFLREHREQAGFASQRSFADHAKISQAMIYRLEIGDRMPSRKMVTKLAAALDMPVKDLVSAIYGLADCA